MEAPKRKVTSKIDYAVTGPTSTSNPTSSGLSQFRPYATLRASASTNAFKSSPGTSARSLTTPTLPRARARINPDPSSPVTRPTPNAVGLRGVVGRSPSVINADVGGQGGGPSKPTVGARDRQPGIIRATTTPSTRSGFSRPPGEPSLTPTSSGVGARVKSKSVLGSRQADDDRPRASPSSLTRHASSSTINANIKVNSLSPFTRTASASSSSSPSQTAFHQPEYDGQPPSESPEAYSPAFSARLPTTSPSNLSQPLNSALSTPVHRLQRSTQRIDDASKAALGIVGIGVSPRSPAREASRRARVALTPTMTSTEGAGINTITTVPTRPPISPSTSGNSRSPASSHASLRSAIQLREVTDSSVVWNGSLESRGDELSPRFSNPRWARTPPISSGSSAGPSGNSQRDVDDQTDDLEDLEEIDDLIEEDSDDETHAMEMDPEQEGAREAKRDRKIADLEISNQSLMTINRALEAAAARKDRLISSLKRQLRASGQAPISYFDLSKSQNGNPSNGQTDSASDLDDNEDDEEDGQDYLDHIKVVDDSFFKLNSALEDMVRRGREAITKVEETKEGERGKVLTVLDLEEQEGGEEDEEGIDRNTNGNVTPVEGGVIGAEAEVEPPI